jgi:HSP20 family protein
MTKAASDVPVSPEKAAEPSLPQPWRPFENLRGEIERLLDDFYGELRGAPSRRSLFEVEPFWRRAGRSAPAVDLVEKEDSYEVTAELPGMDVKDIEVKLVNGALTIKGKKQEEKEEKEKNYYLHERRFGSFERRFAMPEGVDPEKIQARFDKGVLTVTLPKTSEARKPAKTIEVKAAA